VNRGPPGTLRVSLLLAGLAVRRMGNRLALRRRKRAKPGERAATPRKSARSRAALVFFGAYMLFAASMLSSQLVGRLEEQLAPGPRDAALGIVLTLLAASTLFGGVATMELSQAGWTLEWLFTFPVSTRGLFLARVGEYAATSAFGWFMLGPLLVTVYWGGLGAWAIPAGVGAAFALNLIVASVRVVAETALRKTLPLRALKNAQALCTVASMLLLFGAFWLALSRETPPGFLALAERLPRAALWQPLSLPVLLAGAPAAAAALGAVALAFVGAAVAIASHLVRDGLVTTSGGPYAGTRAPAAPAPPHSRLKGMLGKEARLLFRDRNFMVQTLLVPLLILGYQVVVNPQMFEAGGRGAAVLAFGVGAYVLAFGGFSVLAVERQSLWLLYTFPQPLARLLRQKVALWACVAVAYTGAVLAIAWRPGAGSDLATWTGPLFALAGVVVFAAVASGLGVLGTDPFEEGPRRVRQEWMWFYMLVAAMYGSGVYAESVWFRCVLLALFVLLAYAVWQKVAARLPLLLDPTQLPPPQLALSEGIVATLLFFQVQHGFATLLLGTDLPTAAQVAIAYVLAGAFSVAVIAWALKRGKVPLGLGGGLPFAGAALRGLALGAAAGVVGLAYLRLADVVEPLRKAKEAMTDVMAEAAPSRWPLLALVVVAAPLVEEFLFRGLVYRGLRRTARPAVAVVGSALIFAIVHPPVSFAPVFVLGLAAAWGLERTGSLWTPIFAHATYNAAVVALG
jgi:membrane protease YdiL (CAAX protease family)